MTITELRDRTETVQQDGIESPLEIEGCMVVRKRGVDAMEVDAMVGGIEMETITVTTTGWMEGGIIMTGVRETMRKVGVVPGSVESQKEKGEQSISCKKLARENTKQIKSL